jgi:hypothetical protein
MDAINHLAGHTTDARVVWNPTVFRKLFGPSSDPVKLVAPISVTLDPGQVCDVCHQPATRLVRVEDEPLPLALCDACPTESEIAATCAEIRSTWSTAERRRRRAMIDCGRPTTKQKTLDAREAALHGARRALRRLTEQRVATSRGSV